MTLSRGLVLVAVILFILAAIPGVDLAGVGLVALGLACWAAASLFGSKTP